MRRWPYPFILCLAAVLSAAPLPITGSTDMFAVGPQPGWRFQVTRSFDRDGEFWVGEQRFSAEFSLEMEFIEEIERVVAGRTEQVVRKMAKAEGKDGDLIVNLADLGDEYVLSFQDQGFELVFRNTGEVMRSLSARNRLGWPLALDLWPREPLQIGQKWRYQGSDLVRRLAMLEIQYGELDLRVERIQREPSTGLDTAQLRGRLRAYIPLGGVPGLYDARVEIDLPLALGIPFRMEFNGRLHGEGQIADTTGRLQSVSIDSTYQVVQRVSPARAVLAAQQALPAKVPASAAQKARSVPPVPVPAGPVQVAKAPPVPPIQVAPIPPNQPPVPVDPMVDKRDERGATPLIMAALKADLNQMQVLIQRGADLNALDNPGQCALVYAASVGELEAVRLLLKSGADPDVRSPDGSTPIHALVAWKDIHGEYGEAIYQAIRILLDANADVNAVDHDGNTALMSAAHVNNAKLVELLLERGADPAMKDNKGVTARRVAEILGNKDVLPLLPLDPQENGGGRDQSVDARDEKGATALMRAAIRGELETVRDLLRRGADPKASDDKGRNAVFYATVGTEPEVLRLLLSKGSDPNQRSEPAEVPLAILASSKKFAGGDAEAHLATVEALLSGGADPNVRYTDEMTPMMYAALHGNRGMIELLLKHNADVNAKNKDGATAVVIANTFGHTEIVELLLDAGAEVGTGKPK